MTKRYVGVRIEEKEYQEIAEIQADSETIETFSQALRLVIKRGLEDDIH